MLLWIFLSTSENIFILISLSNFSFCYCKYLSWIQYCHQSWPKSATLDGQMQSGWECHWAHWMALNRMEIFHIVNRLWAYIWLRLIDAMTVETQVIWRILIICEKIIAVLCVGRRSQCTGLSADTYCAYTLLDTTFIRVFFPFFPLKALEVRISGTTFGTQETKTLTVKCVCDPMPTDCKRDAVPSENKHWLIDNSQGCAAGGHA